MTGDLWSLPPQPTRSMPEEQVLAAWIDALSLADHSDGAPQPGHDRRPGHDPPGHDVRPGHDPPGHDVRPGHDLVPGRDLPGHDLMPAEIRTLDGDAVAVQRPGWSRPTALSRSSVVVVAAAASFAVGIGLSMATYAVLSRQNGTSLGQGAGTSDGAAPGGHDDRVVLQGTSAGCPVMLVKPRADGTTTGVAGTCFSVG